MRLRDKVILITGSTTGIGLAIAERCVAEGARVLIHGRNEEEGRRIVERLGDRAALHIDALEDSGAPARIVESAKTAFGGIDALVNNAAAIVRSDLGSTSDALFDQVMAVNVRAPLLLIQAAVDELRRRRGAVLNIGSINAYSGEPGLLAYSISKGALMTLSRNLANALGTEGIRVNHFNVGWVLTANEIALQRSLGQAPAWSSCLSPTFAPSGRLILPHEIAAAAVFWLSEESRPISGSVIELEQFSVIGRNPNKV